MLKAQKKVVIAVDLLRFFEKFSSTLLMESVAEKFLKFYKFQLSVTEGYNLLLTIIIIFQSFVDPKLFLSRIDNI